MTAKFKNIAVLMTALDSDRQSQMLDKMAEYGKKHGFNIAAFVWFTGAFEKDKHNKGELNIVNLPDLNLFDGVILLDNVFHIAENKQALLKLISTLTCPVVCIGEKVEGCYYVASDTYSSMRKMVEHFVVDHKLTKLHFVKGIEGNPDAESRFKAYVDVLTEHNIPIEEGRISQGDFYVIGGELAAKEILHSQLSLPEAIICANDIMALTISDILAKNGYRIGEDIFISGYDYTWEGQTHSPTLTSVRCCFDKMGEAACQIIEDICNGAMPEREVITEDEVVLGESCGCGSSGDEHQRDEVRKMQIQDVFRRNQTHQMIEVQKNIMAGNCYRDWLEAVKLFVENLGAEEFYCCTNDDFEKKVFEQGLWQQETMSLQDKMQYTSEVSVQIAYKDETFYRKDNFESRYALDNLFAETEEPKLYIFSPLHYQERNYGYFVWVNSAFPICNPLYINWLIAMGHSIENIRKQKLLKRAVDELNEMYVRDSLTKVYNRFGMDRYFIEIKEQCIRSNKKMMFSFVDVDRLKVINDVQGHESGDAIIRATAMVLRNAAQTINLNMDKEYAIVRYGGDEFIVFGMMDQESEAMLYWDLVQENVDDYNRERNESAALSISYGFELFEVTDETDAMECISQVDSKMYEAKNLKKKARTG